jgi:hypothetical protein
MVQAWCIHHTWLKEEVHLSSSYLSQGMQCKGSMRHQWKMSVSKVRLALLALLAPSTAASNIKHHHHEEEVSR